MIVNWKASIKKLTQTKEKHLLVKNKFKKHQTFDSSYFRGKEYFEEDRTKNYLVFQPMYRYFKKIGSTNRILSCESKELSDEVIKPSVITLAPESIKVKF